MGRLAVGVFVICAMMSVMATAQKDPTRPSSYRSLSSEIGTQVDTTGLSVDAIFVRENSRIAIINGVPLSVGEQQFGAKLIAIHSDKVIVEQMIDGIRQQRTIGVNLTGEVKTNATNNF